MLRACTPQVSCLLRAMASNGGSGMECETVVKRNRKRKVRTFMSIRCLCGTNVPDYTLEAYFFVCWWNDNSLGIRLWIMSLDMRRTHKNMFYAFITITYSIASKNPYTRVAPGTCLHKYTNTICGSHAIQFPISMPPPNFLAAWECNVHIFHSIEHFAVLLHRILFGIWR